MRKALYPGSFDPPTNGHLDVVERLVSLCDSLVVAVVGNPSKTAFFTLSERVSLLEEIVPAGVEVTSHQGLLVDLAEQLGADAIVKGVRGTDDYQNEIRMARMNRTMTGVETLMLPAAPELDFVASTLVREISRLGGDVSHLVPPPVAEAMESKQ